MVSEFERSVSETGPGSATVDLSVVVPIFNERGNLEELMRQIDEALGEFSYEVLAVDDGSTDGSDRELQRLSQIHANLRVIALPHNSGQSTALAAGFGSARGTLVATIDGDLQYDPREIPALVQAISESEADAVVGYRVGRRDSRWKRVQSVIANRTRDFITADRIRDTGCGLKLLRRDILNRIALFQGMHRFIPTLVRIAGGKVVEVPVAHRPRVWGRTKYGVWNRMLRGLLDSMGVRWLKRRALRQVDDGESK